MADEQISELDIDLLEPNPLQPRGLITPESIVELVDSIREHGILEPLVVAKTPAGYQIIAGERRWRASKAAGLKIVPVIVKETSPKGMLEMAIVENVQRVDLNPIERAQAYQRLMDEFNLGNQDIAKRVGKSPAYISNTLRMMALPDVLKDALISGATTEGHARAIAALDDPQLIVEAYREVLKKGLSVRGAEDLARKMKSHYNIAMKSQAKKTQTRIHNDELEEIENRIQDKFNNYVNKAKVKITQSRVQARISIILAAEMDRTTETVKKLGKAISEMN
ncbi:MAG TPA: ParB/RepB/Spo0J family partition protein [Patescibacteria group bacterium]